MNKYKVKIFLLEDGKYPTVQQTITAESKADAIDKVIKEMMGRDIRPEVEELK